MPLYDAPSDRYGGGQAQGLPVVGIGGGGTNQPRNGGCPAGSTNIPGFGCVDLSVLAGLGGSQGSSSGGYGPDPWSSTQAAAQLAGQQTQEQLATQHAQGLEMLGAQGQQTQQQMATQYSQSKGMAAIEQKYTLQNTKLQQQYDKLEAQKNRAFAAGESAKVRSFEAQQQKLQNQFTALESSKQRDLVKWQTSTEGQQEMEQIRLQTEGQMGLQGLVGEQATEQQATDLAWQREKQREQLRTERQGKYVDMLGNDPVRAVLFGLGLGSEADVFNAQAKGLGQALPSLAGMEGQRASTEQALQGIGEKYGGGTGQAQIGKQGVTRLGSPEQSARALAQGGGDVQKMLGSAFGVGSFKTGGLGNKELMRRAQDVTPGGTLQY